jgi:tRNA(Arg) A34 adenosine deaminase TadA
MSESNDAEGWMAEAVAIARTGMQNGGGPFGAVVVCDGKIVGRGSNEVTRLLDPTAHAEITAIRSACRSLQRFDLAGCEIFATCEPCPMCLAAIYWARADRVCYAATRADAAIAGFDDDAIYQEIALDLSARSLPMIQFSRESAMELFHEWRANPHKTLY